MRSQTKRVRGVCVHGQLREFFEAMFRAMDDEVYAGARRRHRRYFDARAQKPQGHRGKSARHDHRAVHRRRERPYAVGYREDGRQAGRRLYHEDRRPHEPFGHHGAFDGHSGGRRRGRKARPDRGRHGAADRRRSRRADRTAGRGDARAVRGKEGEG